jgi:hypothetical protein
MLNKTNTVDNILNKNNTIDNTPNNLDFEFDFALCHNDYGCCK